MIRRPAVANQFYDGDPVRLRAELSRLIPTTAHAKPALAAVSPHAGYIYSGHVAGAVFSRVTVPEYVIVMGPNHTGYGSYAEIMTEGVWQMPLGDVPIASDLADLILSRSNILQEGYQSHLYEHSLEVQIPFLQYLQPDLHIVPICLGPLDLESCLEIGRAVAAAIKAFSMPVLIVASTDMSHYVTADTAKEMDTLAIKRILALDPQGLYTTVKENGISMCGYIPTTIALEASNLLGAKQAELIKYANSGEINGDYNRVVGYAGLAIR
ncbi:MAG: AmmeMemoRadiSam system protein B [Thermodesulfatator sp.]|nr:MAG: AmmeMemoRadiSam system protein B [Thermodesulfatator sp.]